MSRNTQQPTEKQEEEEVWREIFNMFDKDRNGHITKDELGHVLRALDMDPTQKELEEAATEMGKNAIGVIEYSAFRSYMLKMKRSSYEERRTEMIRAFRIIDKNNDTFIDANELMGVLTSLGEPLSKEEVEAMIKVADIDEDGRINYEEFAGFIVSPCI